MVDHVADAYEYIGDWLRQILAGQVIEVSSDIVDRFNADHAKQAEQLGQPTRAQAIDHLNRSGDAIIALIAGLDTAQPDADEGRGSGDSPRSQSGIAGQPPRREIEAARSAAPARGEGAMKGAAGAGAAG